MKMNFKKLVYSALFAALACVCTMSIRIPTPGTSGYIHPGDAVVILAGIFLGPVYGAFAAGIGSCMADLIGGYFIYVPITLVVKAAVAFISGVIFEKVGNKAGKKHLAVILGGITDIIVVAGGYFLCEIPIYTVAGSAASIPANIIQGVSGLLLSFILYPVLNAVPMLKTMKHQNA